MSLNRKILSFIFYLSFYRFSILTYLSQFYHRFNGSDSGISSLSHSPSSSDIELEGRRNLSGDLSSLGSKLARSNSSDRRRGAIHSLMDGRRVRSLSCGGGRKRVRSDSSGSPPIQSENPFRYSTHLETKPVLQVLQEPGARNLEDKPRTLTNVREVQMPEVRKVTLREKKRSSANERMTKSLILETDLNEISSEPELTCSRVKSGSVLSFTSVPSPYRRQESEGRMSLLSQCYKSISPPPPKPSRTYTHSLFKQSKPDGSPTRSNFNPAGTETRSGSWWSSKTRYPDSTNPSTKGLQTKDVSPEAMNSPPRKPWKESPQRKPCRGDSNNNEVKPRLENSEVKNRFENSPGRRFKEESLRHIVNLRIHTDIFKRFARSENSKIKTQKLSSRQPPALPYLQTLV